MEWNDRRNYPRGIFSFSWKIFVLLKFIATKIFADGNLLLLEFLRTGIYCHWNFCGLEFIYEIFADGNLLLLEFSWTGIYCFLKIFEISSKKDDAYDFFVQSNIDIVRLKGPKKFA
jgi:hypothetical protein